MAVINGTAAGTTLAGTADAETINRLGGDDSLFGVAGDGDGNDALVGNSGAHQFQRGDGNDCVDAAPAASSVPISITSKRQISGRNDTSYETKTRLNVDHVRN